jgi:ABC transporter substrate binding protein
MRRREFITLIGGAAAWPLAARAQQAAMPVSQCEVPHSTVGLTAAFRQALNEVGFVDGRNIAIEYRWASNQVDQLPALATELVGLPANVIAAFSTLSARAAKAATTTIPIVFLTGDEAEQEQQRQQAEAAAAAAEEQRRQDEAAEAETATGCCPWPGGGATSRASPGGNMRKHRQLGERPVAEKHHDGNGQHSHAGSLFQIASVSLERRRFPIARYCSRILCRPAPRLHLSSRSSRVHLFKFESLEDCSSKRASSSKHLVEVDAVDPGLPRPGRLTARPSDDFV